jgi:hypothetical protein
VGHFQGLSSCGLPLRTQTSLRKEVACGSPLVKARIADLLAWCPVLSHWVCAVKLCCIQRGSTLRLHRNFKGAFWNSGSRISVDVKSNSEGRPRASRDKSSPRTGIWAWILDGTPQHLAAVSLSMTRNFSPGGRRENVHEMASVLVYRVDV